jgi:hypothetical protein
MQQRPFEGATVKVINAHGLVRRILGITGILEHLNGRL